MVTFYVLYSSTFYVTGDTGAVFSAEFSQQCIMFVFTSQWSLGNENFSSWNLVGTFLKFILQTTNPSCVSVYSFIPLYAENSVHWTFSLLFLFTFFSFLLFFFFLWLLSLSWN